MSSMSTSGTIAVMKARGGIEVSTYASELEAVKAMLNNGSLGGKGSYHGSALHVGALIQVEAAIASIREAIRQDAEGGGTDTDE